MLLIAMEQVQQQEVVENDVDRNQRIIDRRRAMLLIENDINRDGRTLYEDVSDLSVCVLGVCGGAFAFTSTVVSNTFKDENEYAKGFLIGGGVCTITASAMKGGPKLVKVSKRLFRETKRLYHLGMMKYSR